MLPICAEPVLPQQHANPAAALHLPLLAGSMQKVKDVAHKMGIGHTDERGVEHNLQSDQQNYAGHSSDQVGVRSEVSRQSVCAGLHQLNWFAGVR